MGVAWKSVGENSGVWISTIPDIGPVGGEHQTKPRSLRDDFDQHAPAYRAPTATSTADNKINYSPVAIFAECARSDYPGGVPEVPRQCFALAGKVPLGSSIPVGGTSLPNAIPTVGSHS